MNKTFIKGSILTLLAGVCWGFSGIVGQYLFQKEGVSSQWLIIMRSTMAGVMLMIFSLIKYGPATTFKPWKDRTERTELLVYGVLGISSCQFMYLTTIKLAGASMATILQSVSPVIIMIVMCVLERRRPGKIEILCVALAVTGVALVTIGGNTSSMTVTPIAVVTGLLSAAAITIYNVCPRHLLVRYPVPMLQAHAFCMGTIVFFFIFRAWTMDWAQSSTAFIGAIVVAVIGSVVPFVLFMTGVKYIGPELSVLYGFSEPMTSAILTAVLFASPLSSMGIIGFILIFVTMVLISCSEHA